MVTFSATCKASTASAETATKSSSASTSTQMVSSAVFLPAATMPVTCAASGSPEAVNLVPLAVTTGKVCPDAESEDTTWDAGQKPPAKFRRTRAETYQLDQTANNSTELLVPLRRPPPGAPISL